MAEVHQKLARLEKQKLSMESLVSVIDKAWSQLDLDIGTLLSGLDGGCDIPSTSSPQIFSAFIEAGAAHALSELSSSGIDLSENLDAFSSADETVEEKNRLIKEIKSGTLSCEMAESSMISALDSRISFTKEVLRRCWAVIERSPEAHSALPIDIIERMVALKERAAKTGHFESKMLKCRSESLELLFELRRVHEEKRKLERSLDKALEENQKSLATIKGSGIHSTVPSSAIKTGMGRELQVEATPAGKLTPSAAVNTPATGTFDTPASTPASASTPAVAEVKDTDLLTKCTILEKQLDVSANEIMRLERELTKCLSCQHMPEETREQYREDVVKVVTILKAQIDSTVTTQRNTIKEVNEKLFVQAEAIREIQNNAERLIKRSAGMAETEKKKYAGEAEALNAKLVSAKQDLVDLETLKRKLHETEISLQNKEMEGDKLHDSAKSLRREKENLESLLKDSRAREVELEKRLAVLGSKSGYKEEVVNGDLTQLMNTLEPGEERTVDDLLKALDSDLVSPFNLGKAPLIYIAQKRFVEAQNQIEEAATNEKDLLMELESVTEELSKLKSTIADLHRQIAKASEKQSAYDKKEIAIDAEVTELRKRVENAVYKEGLSDKYQRSQDILISDLRAKIRTLEQNVAKLTEINDDWETKGLYHGTAELEGKEQLEAKHAEILTANETITRLEKRCEELTVQYQSERKQRMALEREPSASSSMEAGTGKKSKKGDTKTPSGSFNDQDATMLDITLSMLRCSVCQDRFKNCVITRCMHLFCLECIETNLANRQRKCPMCGDKFGQDDVKKVYYK